MVKLHKIAGSVMEYLDAFKNSRPALNSKFILIVRGLSAKNIPISEMNDVLNGLVEHLDGKVLEDISDNAAKLINRMDEQIRSAVNVVGDTDSGGIMRMKKDLENLNVITEYRLINLQHAGVFIAMWKDKGDFGPVFVEVVVSDDEDIKSRIDN
ncbi:MAG: DUF2120 domain-containing protein [Methanobrevibacter sp.]|jgi:hypothetical protein|nr:DUF2120 domain-containing protein [Candidatus Methanovirga aequatorialis]